MPKTAGQLFKDLVIKLTGTYESSEAKAISYLLLEEKFDIPKSLVLLDKEVPFKNGDKERFKEYRDRLQNHEPIQHIIGKGYFYNRPFKVTPDVLVPRQETEELISRIVRENRRREKTSILDIGTGSGNIIVSLGLELKNMELKLKAWDKSTQALIIAEENANKYDVSVEFDTVDILEGKDTDEKFDIIVSNPPYVKNSEKLKMKKNVLKFDPHEALFVPNDDPLIFYRVISKFAKSHLNPKGKLYFEINESLGNETADLIHDMGYSKVKLIKDLNDKDRFVSAIL